MLVSFSSRLPGGLEENALWEELSRKRKAFERLWDLTSSNPTRAGFHYPEREILESLSSRDALTYEPDPQGLESARLAVAGYYRERGVSVSREDIWLTTGTSEAYSFVFKLLGGPSDRVLVPRPSYPLFDILASLDVLEPVAYPLILDGTWRIDFDALESLAPNARVLVGASPG